MHRKKILNVFEWLFFAFYIIMPPYFAIEISSSLPLLTASRLILLLLFISILKKNNWKMKLTHFDRRIEFYFLCMFFIDVIHLVDSGTYAINDLFKIITEQLLVYWCIVTIINSKEKLYAALKLMFGASGIVALISIIGYFFNTNFFYLLKTTNRDMLMTGLTNIGYRSGMLRIEAGFSHPVYYGAYLCIMLFIGVYLLLRQNRPYYIVCMFLNFIALLLCNSRGSILAFVVAVVYAFFFNGKKERRKYFKYFSSIVLVIALVILLVPSVQHYLSVMFNSIIVYFGGTSSLSLDNYGANLNFFTDRWMQMSGIWWTLLHKPIIGFGPSAHSRGLISFEWMGRWSTTNTMDMGYVGIICEYGLLGFIAFICLFSIPFINKHRKQMKNNMEDHMFKNIFVVYLLCLLSVVTQDKIFWVIFSLFVAYSKLLPKENNSQN